MNNILGQRFEMSPETNPTSQSTRLFLVLAGIVILTLGMALPVAYWPLHGCLFCIVVVLQAASGVTLPYLLRRLGLFLPTLFLLTGGLWLSVNTEQGQLMLVAIVLRSLLSFMVGLWLIAAIPFDELLLVLRRLCVPRVLIAILSFMYRYSMVFTDEYERLRRAQASRTFRAQGWMGSWQSLALSLGQLFVRSLSRATRIHQAMCSRGWTGEIHTLNK